MDPTYVTKVQEWVVCDNILTKNKEEMKSVQDKKKELEDDILSYIEDNKYDKLVINISDGAIKFGKRNVMQSLSMKLVRQILSTYEDGALDVDRIMKHIEDSLESKPKSVMKREIKL